MSASAEDEKKAASAMKVPRERIDCTLLPIHSEFYSPSAALMEIEKYPMLRIKRDGKYYMKMKDEVVERNVKVKRNNFGKVIRPITREKLGPIEHVISNFCETVLCISRSAYLPLSSQGQRHLIWVGKRKANHIIRHLNGNGCYIVNRFPGDIFLKDKQVLGVTMLEHMLFDDNKCSAKECDTKLDKRRSSSMLAGSVCRHMVKNLKLNCEDKKCRNFNKRCCAHMNIFIPEIQSFCTYNKLQQFANRMEDELKEQTFVCKPAYLNKGLGFRFFRHADEFKTFYHMTEGKATSRHDFMVQRMVEHPFLFDGRKIDIRAFLLVIVLNNRRVVSFVHHGFCRVAAERYDENDFKRWDTQPHQGASDAGNDYEKKMRMIVCNYMSDNDKLKWKQQVANGIPYEKEKDTSQLLETVFTEKAELDDVKQQISSIALCVTKTIENKVWEKLGCFQIFGLDLAVDKERKVWLLEVNSGMLSFVDTLSPTQRLVMPAVIQEAIGLVMETMYKSNKGLRLRKSPNDEFTETGFLFRQNFEFIFSTLACKRSDYKWKPMKVKDNMPFFRRISEVDRSMERVAEIKRRAEDIKQKVQAQKQEFKEFRRGKDFEMS